VPKQPAASEPHRVAEHHTPHLGSCRITQLKVLGAKVVSRPLKAAAPSEPRRLSTGLSTELATQYAKHVGEEPAILDTAHRHGVAEADMLHAYRHPLFLADAGQGVTMYIGPARPGFPLLEIGVTTWYEMTVIIHAMPARAKFLR